MTDSGRPLQFRVSQEWLDQLDATIRTLSPDNETSNRSSFVRGALEMEKLLWRRSPYLCRRAGHFIFVNKSGDFLYQRNEDLVLNTTLSQLPAQLSLKLEKQYRSAEPDEDRGESAWDMNAFILAKDSKVLRIASDDIGRNTKAVLFTGALPAGTEISRSACFLLPGYAQFHEGGKDQIQDLATDDKDSIFDRAEIELDIPTRYLDMTVVVDLELFKHSPELLSNPSLKFDIRNREGVSFGSVDSAEHFLRQRQLRRIGSWYGPGKQQGDARYEETVEHIHSCFAKFHGALGQIKHMKPEKGNISQESLERTERLLVRPQRYRFYRVQWFEGVHVGLMLSVKWPKPWREEKAESATK